MKKRTKITLGAVACVLAAMGGVAWWQWNTLEAVVQAVQYTPEEIEEKQKENQQKVHQAVEANPSITVRDLTEEEKQALREGTVTQEELAEKLLETVLPSADADKVPAAPQPLAAQPTEKEEPPPQTPPAQTPEEAPKTEPPPPATSEEVPPPQSQWEKDLSALIARVYVLREEYTIVLDNMQTEAKEEYRGMKNRTKKNLAKFAQGYVGRALELEKTCDRQMDEIVTEMELILSENGGDMTLVDTVVETYASEKSLKKAWYMAELEKRGWI